MKGEKTMLKRQKNFRSLCMTIGLATALTFMIVSPASAIELPGPDEFGYIINQIEGNLRELSTHENTVHLTLGDDAVSEPITLPFPFLFYGVSVAEVYISSNGFISFSSGQGTGGWEGGLIPDPLVPNNIIAGFWEDLNPAHISSGYISHATIVGEDGNQEFVVEFEKVPHYLNESPLTFQIILHEGSNNIELQYGEAMGDSDSQPFTVGIENDDGTMGMQIVHGDASFDNEGFLISNPLIEEFEVQSANVSLGRGQELDKYDIMGAFTLSDFSDGAIDPIGEGVTIKVGTSSLTIPPNSFEAKQGKSGVEFQGSIDGALVHVSIEAVGALSFRYHVEAHKVDLSDSTIPLKFSLKMGTDVGVTTIPLHGYLRTGKKHNYLGLNTDLNNRSGSLRNYSRTYR
jgi:hypothetical protein